MHSTNTVAVYTAGMFRRDRIELVKFPAGSTVLQPERRAGIGPCQREKGHPARSKQRPKTCGLYTGMTEATVN